MDGVLHGFKAKTTYGVKSLFMLDNMPKKN
jgi:hypothetical protein